MIVPSQRLQLAKDREGLPREGNDVGLSSLHPAGWNPPFSLPEVKLTPSGMTQFARPHENQWRQAQRILCDQATIVAVDCSQQCADFCRTRE